MVRMSYCTPRCCWLMGWGYTELLYNLAEDPDLTSGELCL